MEMDLKILLATFGMVFLAELGDKTQVATFCLSAECDGARLSVFLGSAVALVLSSLLAVFLGDTVGRWIPPAAIKFAAGAFFLVAGIWTLTGAVRSL
jgi:putative Ca2+/H+ antiporter (TMEM165/GDT1 family)